MEKTRRMAGMLGIMAMAAAMGGNYGHFASGGNRGEYLEGAPPKNPAKVIPKGHQLFNINGTEIYALNRKNAEKKYNKLKN